MVAGVRRVDALVCAIRVVAWRRVAICDVDHPPQNRQRHRRRFARRRSPIAPEDSRHSGARESLASVGGQRVERIAERGAGRETVHGECRL